MFDTKKVEIEWGGQTLSLETGALRVRPTAPCWPVWATPSSCAR
jgi:hypothetical protein